MGLRIGIIFLLFCSCCHTNIFVFSVDAPIVGGVEGFVEMKKNNTGADSCWVEKIKGKNGKVKCQYCE